MKLISARQLEEWKEVPGFEEIYEVSTTGRVRSLDRVVDHPVSIKKTVRGRELKPARKKSGYYHVNLQKGGKQHTKYIHRLVLEVFVSPCPEGMECRHLDYDQSNNNLSNLEWGTHKENCLDRSLNRKKGWRLTESDAKEILAQKGKMTQTALAKRYGVTQAAISAIHRGFAWGHLEGAV